jgi:Protein of unknown function (DUF4236)
MGLRFSRHVNTGLGRIKISKSGINLSKGVRGFHVTLGRTPRVTIGAPGTGLSYTTTLPRGGRRSGGGTVIGHIGGSLIGIAIGIGFGWWSSPYAEATDHAPRALRFLRRPSRWPRRC